MGAILRQRTIVLIAVAIAGFLFWKAAPGARPASGVNGASLLLAASPVEATARFVGVGVLAAIVAGIAAGLTNPLMAPFVLGVGLCFAAVTGGSVDEWMRTVNSSGAYWMFAGESVTWLVIMATLLLLASAVGGFVYGQLPMSWRDSADLTQGPYAIRYGAGYGGAMKLLWAATVELSKVTRLSGPAIHGLAAMVVAAAIGSVVTPFLVVSALTWQVVWGVGFAFCFGGLVAYTLFPARPVWILLSPLLSAMGWYAWIAVSNISTRELLVGYFQDPIRAPHASLIFPIYYASAGVAGAALGIGWSMVLMPASGGNEGVPEAASIPRST
jgi:hypothetical protein